MQKRRVLAGLTILTCGFASSCGTGAVGEAARPKAETANSALEEGESRGVDKGGEPLIVDWKPEQRGDLEIAMKDGVAVVNYSCKSIEVLPDCKLDGSYGFMGMTRKEQLVRLENADEVRANLPLSGVSISAELDRGSTIDIAMIIIGKQRTTWEGPTAKDLKGKCEGATHYVRGAVVGAFAVDTGTRAKARAAAEVFGAGASTASSSKKDVKTKEGDMKACSNAKPSSDSAPDQCGAPIRLVLAPIEKAALKGPPDKPVEEKPKAVAKAEEHECPAGMVYTDGKCTTPASAPAYQCKSGDESECKAQCDKGHAGSCGSLGVILANKRDYAGGAAALKKACDGDDADGCTNLGMLHEKGLGMTADVAGAVKLFEKGCSGGDAVGCTELGRSYQLGNGGLTADLAKAAELYEQGCDGGNMVGCAFSGAAYLDGKGVTADPVKSAAFYKRACEGGHGESCGQVGEAYEVGRGVGTNAIIAEMMYRRGCFRGADLACVGLARLQIDSRPDDAKRYFERACNFKRDTLACAVVKVAFKGQSPVIPKGNEMTDWMRACNSGSSRDCATQGVVQAAQGNAAMGKTNLQRACSRGDKFACAMAKKL